MNTQRNVLFTGAGWVIEDASKEQNGSKIIDAHSHVFPRLGSQRQGIDQELRLKFWQFHSREWSNFWRKDDGTHVTTRFLQFGSDNIADMPGVDSRLISRTFCCWGTGTCGEKATWQYLGKNGFSKPKKESRVQVKELPKALRRSGLPASKAWGRCCGGGGLA